MLGQFQANDAKATARLRKQLEGWHPDGLKLTLTAPPPTVTDPASQWVTLQLRGDAQAVRKLLGNAETGNK